VENDHLWQKFGEIFGYQSQQYDISEIRLSYFLHTISAVISKLGATGYEPIELAGTGHAME